jgi:hypothetical protein
MIFIIPADELSALFIVLLSIIFEVSRGMIVVVTFVSVAVFNATVVSSDATPEAEVVVF